MNIPDPDFIPRSVLCVFAHPDDPEFTVAGTMAKWAAAGCRITYLMLTSGNAGSHDPTMTRERLGEIREAEERKAAQTIGVAEVVFLRHNDCELVPTLELRKEIVREIRRARPEVVVCQDPQSLFFDSRYINHPDHRAAGQATIDAVFPAPEMQPLWPELGPPHAVHLVYVSSTFQPNTWVDTTATLDAKIASLRCHDSQFDGWDPSEMMREWGAGEAAKARAAGQGTEKTLYAEAFRAMKLRRDR